MAKITYSDLKQNGIKAFGNKPMNLWCPYYFYKNGYHYIVIYSIYAGLQFYIIDVGIANFVKFIKSGGEITPHKMSGFGLKDKRPQKSRGWWYAREFNKYAGMNGFDLDDIDRDSFRRIRLNSLRAAGVEW